MRAPSHEEVYRVAAAIYVANCAAAESAGREQDLDILQSDAIAEAMSLWDETCESIDAAYPPVPVVPLIPTPVVPATMRGGDAIARGLAAEGKEVSSVDLCRDGVRYIEHAPDELNSEESDNAQARRAV